MECPLCGAGLPTARPRHQVSLVMSDDARSSVAADAETTVNAQVCEDCWADIKDDLS